MSVKDDLLAAADLLAQPGAWCQEVWARDARGNELMFVEAIRSDRACSWCIQGALMHVAKEVGEEARTALVRQAEREGIPNGSYVQWQDEPGRTQAEVVAFVRRTAEAAE